MKHGDVVGIGRTPTVSLAFCVVKFSREYGRIGYIHMSFAVWAAGNNGDTDGDPCNRVLVGAYRNNMWRGVNYQRAAKMNEHPLSMAAMASYVVPSHVLMTVLSSYPSRMYGLRSA
jgi:hypothetical protein